MASVPLVRVIRSGLEESVHAGDVAVVDGAGHLVAHAGDPDRPLFARSSMKPLQATVSLSLAPFEFSDKEVAVMCASHNAEPVHVEAVRSLMARAGVGEAALQCPAMRPWDDETAASDPQRRRINSDCSGKHGGMLAACLAQGWPTDSYRWPGHPLQQRVREAVLAVTGLDTVHVGVDGCGVPVHGLPLRSMATIYARLSSPDRWGSLAPFADRAGRAMAAEPYMVAGRNRVDTAVMQAAPGILAKGGAEGLICAVVMGAGLGVAVKVADGTHRAAAPALIHALDSLGALDQAQVGALAVHARPPVLGGGERVGELQPAFSLTPS
jgi:L-asparaginase II